MSHTIHLQILGYMKERARRGSPHEGWTQASKIPYPKAAVQKAVRTLREDGLIEMGKRGWYRPVAVTAQRVPPGPPDR